MRERLAQVDERTIIVTLAAICALLGLAIGAAVACGMLGPFPPGQTVHYDRLADIRGVPERYAGKDVEVHVRGTVGRVFDVPFSSARYFTLTEDMTELPVRTSQCRAVEAGQQVELRAKVFSGLDLGPLGTVGTALVEVSFLCS